MTPLLMKPFKFNTLKVCLLEYDSLSLITLITEF